MPHIVPHFLPLEGKRPTSAVSGELLPPGRDRNGALWGNVFFSWTPNRYSGSQMPKQAQEHASNDRKKDELKMDTPLEIAWHNVEKSEPLEARIRDRVEKLHRYFSRINSCHIVVERPHRSQHHGKEFHLRIEVRVPEHEIVISNDPGDRNEHFDPNIAIRDAFDAMERRLEAHSQKMRGDIKTLVGPPHGVVVRLFEAYGFARMRDGQEIYFAPNAVLNEGFEALEVGSPVELTVAEGEGAMGPQASMVRPISDVSLESERRAKA